MSVSTEGGAGKVFPRVSVLRCSIEAGGVSMHGIMVRTFLGVCSLLFIIFHDRLKCHYCMIKIFTS